MNDLRLSQRAVLKTTLTVVSMLVGFIAGFVPFVSWVLLVAIGYMVAKDGQFYKAMDGEMSIPELYIVLGLTIGATVGSFAWYPIFALMVGSELLSYCILVVVPGVCFILGVIVYRLKEQVSSSEGE